MRKPTPTHAHTEHVEPEHAGVGRPVDVFALGAVPDQFTAVRNVPYGENTVSRLTYLAR